VIAEALATALPIVATAVGGVPGAVPPEAGRLLPHGDEAGLRVAIAALREDGALRERMGRIGRAHALHRYALSTMADRYEALYRAGS
jgi:glycosyltransferase involved in cell wall biosynthesis